MSKNNKLRIDFSNGEAAQHVTGSCVYLPDLHSVIECGLSQSNNLLKDYTNNKAKFNFSCKTLKWVFVGHAHLDHTGRLPLLYKRGCTATIFVPKGNYEIIKNMLTDSANIMARDARLLSTQRGREYEPLYDIADVENALSHMVEVPMKEMKYVDDNITIRYIPSGHIKYAAQIEFYITYNGVKKKLGYTSDLGNYVLPKHFSEEFEPIEKCDVLIGECTYSDGTRPAANKKQRKNDLAKMESVIQNYCVDNKAKVLIPCFALDRTPELYMELRSIMKKNGWDVPILIDSPLSVKQFELYAQDCPELNEEVASSRTRLCSAYTESLVWQKMPGPMIILSSSGMMTAGRVLAHLPKVLADSRNCILFCGFSTEGTLAWKIKNSRKSSILVNDKWVANKASIVVLNSFSSHMQHDQLLEYYSSINCNKIFLVHGQQKEKVIFANELRDKIARACKTTQVVCVNESTEGKF